jgi:hypothetical protein
VRVAVIAAVDGMLMIEHCVSAMVTEVEGPAFAATGGVVASVHW